MAGKLKKTAMQIDPEFNDDVGLETYFDLGGLYGPDASDKDILEESPEEVGGADSPTAVEVVTELPAKPSRQPQKGRAEKQQRSGGSGNSKQLTRRAVDIDDERIFRVTVFVHPSEIERLARITVEVKIRARTGEVPQTALLRSVFGESLSLFGSRCAYLSLKTFLEKTVDHEPDSKVFASTLPEFDRKYGTECNTMIDPTTARLLDDRLRENKIYAARTNAKDKILTEKLKFCRLAFVWFLELL